MKIKLIFIAFSLILSGCDIKLSIPPKDIKVRCSAEQIKLVDAQFNICNKTGYINTYCYDQARVEYCDHVDSDELK